MSVDEALGKISDGDVLLFNSKTRSIQAMTYSRWTHVGIAIRRDGKLCIAEAVATKWYPGPHAGGVQVVPLEEKYRVYDVGGEFAWRKVARPSSFSAEKLAAAIDEQKDKPFQADSSEMARAGTQIPGFEPEFETLETLFCSEFVVWLYQQLGALPTDPPSNNYVPGDFSSDSRPHTPLAWREGWSLGPEIGITRVEDRAAIAQFDRERQARQDAFVASSQ